MIVRLKTVIVAVFMIVLAVYIGVSWKWEKVFVPAQASNGYGKIIDKDTTWEAGSEHTFDESVAITDGAHLRIEPGAKIVFSGDYDASGPIYFDINEGTVDAIGTEENPIVFSKENDQTVFMIRFQDQSVFGPESGVHVSEFRHVRIERGGERVSQIYQVYLPFHDLFANVAHAEEFWQAEAAVTFRYGRVRILDSIFFGSGGADIWMTDPLDTGISGTDEGDARGLSEFSVSGSDFKGSPRVPAFMSGTGVCPDPEQCRAMVTLTNDWYGSATGPRTDHGGGDGNSKLIEGTVNLDGFSPTEFFAVCHSCASNVLFLPGAKGSRLYMKDESGNENRVWLPHYFSDGLSDLAFDSDGKSINEIYTNDVLDEVGMKYIGPNIYKSFLSDLAKMKNDGVMNGYEPFAYDWRMNVKDVVSGDTAYPAGRRSLFERTQALAQSSKTGKVTIIAHSNGGLVAKELIDRLNADGKAGLVDRVVIVGTPQMGAPIAILTLLYGYKETVPTLITRADARALAENMPGAYGLLPSSEYFDRTEDPIITFSSKNTRSKSFLDAYGSTIEDRGEFEDFLTAEKDGRDKPAKDAVDRENILNGKLLSQAKDTQDELDSWIPPSGVEVIQIAGWGLDTVRGVEYAEKQKATCDLAALVPACTKISEYEPIYEPQFTVDGDKVVTAPSALMLSESSNVKKYWVDLYRSDKVFSKHDHSNLFEIDPLRTFFSQIITRKENESSLPNYIETSRPSDYKDAKPRIRMSLYSPLDVSVTDASGRHTGPMDVTENGHTYTTVEEGIPGSTYYQFGERKYVSFPEGMPVDIRLDGYDSGSYTLQFEEVAVTKTGEETVHRTIFEDLPVTATTTVSLTVPKEGLGHLSTLRGDVNGDAPGGEYEVAPVMNGTATLVAPPVVTVVNDTTASEDTTDSSSDSSGSANSKDSNHRSTAGFSGVLDLWNETVSGSETPDVNSDVSTDSAMTDRLAEVFGIADSPFDGFFSAVRIMIRILLSSPFLPLNMIVSLWGASQNGNGVWPETVWMWQSVIPSFLVGYRGW